LLKWRASMLVMITPKQTRHHHKSTLLLLPSRVRGRCRWTDAGKSLLCKPRLSVSHPSLLPWCCKEVVFRGQPALVPSHSPRTPGEGSQMWIAVLPACTSTSAASFSSRQPMQCKLIPLILCTLPDHVADVIAALAVQGSIRIRTLTDGPAPL
jgi:hypothetical protein